MLEPEASALLLLLAADLSRLLTPGWLDSRTTAGSKSPAAGLKITATAERQL
jgi:hypothetical protein